MSSLALCVFCGLIVFFGKVRGEFLINDFRLSPLYGNLMPTDSPLTSAIVNDVIQCAKLCRHSKACVGFFYDDVRLCLVYDVRFSVLTYNTQNGIRAYGKKYLFNDALRTFVIPQYHSLLLHTIRIYILE